MRDTLRWLVPAVITTAILVYLLGSIGVRDVVDAISLESLSMLIPVIVVYVAVSLWLEGLSISLLSRHTDHRADTRTCSRIKAASYAVGMVNYAVGAAVLTVLLRRRVGLSVQSAAGLVATISVTDLAMMLGMALGAAAISTSQSATLQIGLVIGVIAGLIGGLGFLRAPFSMGPLDRLRDLDLFRIVRSAPWSLLMRLAALRIAFVSTFVFAGFGSLRAFDIQAPLADTIWGLSAAALVGAVPIAVSGVGPVQVTIVYLFESYGNKETLLACSLAMQAAMLTIRAGLGLLFAREYTREAVEATRGAET